MKNLLFIFVLIVTGGLSAQQLSEDMTMALKGNDVAALSALVTDANKEDCYQMGRSSSNILQLSVQLGSISMTEMLIDDKNVDIDAICGNYNALTWAAKNGTAEQVSLLLQKGADKTIAANNKTALQWAQRFNRTDIIALLTD